MDDSSDKSSIISSEVQSQRLSTFSRTTNRSDSFSIANRNTLAPANNSNKNQYKPILNSSMSNHSQISPSIFSQKDVMPMTDIRVRRNTIATNVVRPDSILSTDSFYPMPPPPLTDFSPFKQLDKDNVDDCTLKRSKTYPTPAYIPEDKEDCNFSSVMPPNDLVNATNNPVQTPPVPPPPPQNIAPPALAPPPPQPPPPPPPAPPLPPGCAPPPPSVPLSSVPKPILKLPKPTPKPPAPAMHPTLEFDSHFRQALAKRRQKIESDQNSVASFDIGDNVSKGSLRITPSALKQNETYTRSASNKWTNVNSKEHEISNINGNNPFQRTRSDVYSANILNNVRKTEDNTSRLYLI